MENLKIQLIKFLKGEFLKLALKKILGSAAAGGFKAWLVKYIATELFEEVAEPLIKWQIRKGMLAVDKINGSIKVKKYEKAKEAGDESTYTDVIGSV
jgi:hypothetical protein